jgi:lipopolysaccharide export system permease protein
MKVLHRYIFMEIVQFSGLSLAVFMGVLITAKMLRLTSMVVNKGVELSQIGTIFLAIVPTFLEIALPMSVLLGVMLAFGRLSGDSEIVVMRASGVVFRSLIKPVLLFATIATALSFIISFSWRPWGNRTLEDELFAIASFRGTAILTEGVFNNLGNLTIYAETIDYHTNRLTHVMIDDRRNPESRQIIVSTSGRLSADPRTRLMTIELTTGAIHATNQLNKKDAGYTITHFQSNRLLIDPSENGLAESRTGRRPRELSLSELRHEVATTRDALALRKIIDAHSKDITNPLPVMFPLSEELTQLVPLSREKLRERKSGLQIEVARKFSFPVATFLFALLAMPLGIQPARSHRTWGQTLSALLALIVIIVYYGLLSIGITIAKSDAMPAAIALWIPNIVFAFVTYFFLHQMGSEKWQSLLHGIEVVLQRASAWMARSETAESTA